MQKSEYHCDINRDKQIPVGHPRKKTTETELDFFRASTSWFRGRNIHFHQVPHTF